MARCLKIRKHEDNNKRVLYYFTDYATPISKIASPIENCMEGFVEINKATKAIVFKEYTGGIGTPKKKWIIDCVEVVMKKLVEKDEYPDVADFMS
jgi:hypothetical protein